MKLSIIIVSYNTKKLTKQCVDSVLKHTRDIEFEIIFVDNHSTDGSVEMLSTISKQYPNIKLVKSDENLGFGGANNVGIEKSQAEYVLLLNSDTIVTSNLVKEMVDWMDKHVNVGVSGCALKNEDGSYQGSGGYFPNLLNVFSWMTIQDLPFVDRIIKPFHPMKERNFQSNISFYKKARKLDWVTGAYMLIRKEALDRVGLFDSDYFMYTEETDLCFRLCKAGYSVFYLPQWEIIHLGGASSTREYAVLAEFEGVKTFFRKHRTAWQYPLLRGILKLGSLLRIIPFGKTYYKAFKQI